MIRKFHKEGLSVSEIARRTGHDRKTVRRIIAAEGYPTPRPRSKRPSKLDPFKDFVEERVAKGVTNAVKLLRELRGRGYDGGISILRDFVAPLRATCAPAIVRFETEPGKQAQADWGVAGKIYEGGTLRTVYVFVMTLSWSRMMYIEFTTRADTRAFIRAHINAFAYFGGVTETILYDNLKSVRLSLTENGVRLN